jgi:NAD(P)-dependent dehydrogenase (short-subunit alcohol dehydrogenase family)
MKAEIAQFLVQGGGGAIVNTASVSGLVGLPLAAAYTASKHGVIGLTKTAAIEYATNGIRVNAICPGFVRTKMTADAMERAGAQVLMMTPQRRIAEPEEIAELVVWLCSERASFAAGAAYAIDGGYTAL